MCSWLFNVCMDGIVKMRVKRMGLRFANCLTSCMQMTVLCGESEEDLRAIIRCFDGVCKRGSLKVNKEGGREIRMKLV